MASSSSSSSSSKHLLLLFLVCVLLCRAWPTAARILDNDHDDVQRKFKEWTEKYSREYKNEAEKFKRLGIFADNVKYVAEFLKAAGKDHSYTVGLNQFADLTNDEFLESHTGFKLPPTATSRPTAAGPAAAPLSSHHNALTTDGGVPSSIDWRTRGAVTAVKNQGTCGSCWAFSAVAAIESALLIEGQPPTDLSEQELVDCDSNSSGCDRGWMDAAFAFVTRNGGITTEASYPYVERQGVCNVTRVQHPLASISGHRGVPANDEGALMEAVAQQPVSVAIAIDTSGRDFQLYSGGGIFDGPCGTTLNHAVTLVGYGEDERGKYWIAKNSWGTSWGEQGYILMKKDVPQKEGLCGIAMHASYPTV